VAKPAATKTPPRSRPKPIVISPAEPATTIPPRYFEFIGGTSQKFWEIAVNGAEATARYGRIGSHGQTKTKSFSDAAAAAQHAEKLIAEKTREGYVEANSGGTP
jgi:predicted DNA-binding WGR domain protein